MKRFLPLLLLFPLGGPVCFGDVVFQFEGFPEKVMEGDVLPPLTISDIPDVEVRLELLRGDKDGELAPFSGTHTRTAVGGVVTFDDIVVHSTGEYVFLARVGDSKDGDARSPRFTVSTRSWAEISCQPDGRLGVGAAVQSPLPTVIGEGGCRMVIEPCPVGTELGTVNCTFPGGSAECTTSGGGCSVPGAQHALEPGAVFTATWTGGTHFPAGTATAVLPSPIDAELPPATHSRSAALRVPFVGGPAEGTVQLMLMPKDNLDLTIECFAPTSAGELIVPPAMLGQLPAGDTYFILRHAGRTSVKNGDYVTTLVVPAMPDLKFRDAITFTLE